MVMNREESKLREFMGDSAPVLSFVEGQGIMPRGCWGRCFITVYNPEIQLIRSRSFRGDSAQRLISEKCIQTQKHIQGIRQQESVRARTFIRVPMKNYRSLAQDSGFAPK